MAQDCPTALNQKVENCTKLTLSPQGVMHKTLTPAALNQNAEESLVSENYTKPNGTDTKITRSKNVEINSGFAKSREPIGTVLMLALHQDA